MLAVFIAASVLAPAQLVLRREDAAKVGQALDEGVEGKKLDCQIEHVKPFLDFAFRFETGYIVRCPVRLFEGKAVHMAVYARVTPTVGQAVVLGLDFTTPEIPADMRARTELRRLENNFELSGGLTLGEGEYNIDLLIVDATDRVTRSHWKVKAVRAKGESDVPLAMQPSTVGQLVTRPWDGTLAGPGTGLRVTLLLDAAPRDPNSTRLRAWDRSFLMDSVSSMLKQLPVESVRLVAFNLEQQREIFREENFTRSAFRRLGRALRELELGTVSYGVLKNQQGWAELLAGLTNREVREQNPSDVVIFLGPVTRLMSKLPPESIEQARGSRPAFFDFEYFPVWLRGGEFPDVIHYATTARNGTVIKIHSPGELARGIRRMIDTISATKLKAAN